MTRGQYCVYVLQSKKDNNLYIGFTRDFTSRLKLHNKGKIFATKGRKPFRLVYSERYDDENEAVRREKYLKSGSGREFVRQQIKIRGRSSIG